MRYVVLPIEDARVVFPAAGGWEVLHGGRCAVPVHAVARGGV